MSSGAGTGNGTPTTRRNRSACRLRSDAAAGRPGARQADDHERWRHRLLVADLRIPFEPVATAEPRHEVPRSRSLQNQVPPSVRCALPLRSARVRPLTAPRRPARRIRDRCPRARCAISCAGSSVARPSCFHPPTSSVSEPVVRTAPGPASPARLGIWLRVSFARSVLRDSRQVFGGLPRERHRADRASPRGRDRSAESARRSCRLHRVPDRFATRFRHLPIGVRHQPAVRAEVAVVDPHRVERRRRDRRKAGSA